MDKITTTLAQIRKHSPCEDGYKKLCKNLGGIRKYGKDTPVTFRQIYESNGYDDTLWCLRTVDEKWFSLWRHFACDAAEAVWHLLKDERSLNAIEVARKHADGLATDEELDAARDDAVDAAEDAAGDARDARDAAWVAVRVATGFIAWAAARDAAWAAAWAAAGDATRVDGYTRATQMERLFKYCETGERVK